MRVKAIYLNGKWLKMQIRFIGLLQIIKKKLVYRRTCNKPELAVKFIFMSKEGRDC